MVKSEVLTRNGLKITIEGSTEEVKEIINFIQNKEIPEKNKESNVKKTKIENVRKKGSKINSIILDLREEGFFDKAKGPNEVKDALVKEGHIYEVTVISMALLRLVRKKVLGRVKVNKKWCYVKRGG